MNSTVENPEESNPEISHHRNLETVNTLGYWKNQMHMTQKYQIYQYIFKSPKTSSLKRPLKMECI